jgi:class 3 adenylate cyclase
MAWEMLEAARRRDTEIRVGLCSGECIAGNFGSEVQMNYTIIGSVVNAAARLQSASAPGRILIAESTRRLLGPGFTCEPQGSIQLRGIAQPLLSWWVTAIDQVESEALPQPTETPAC